MKISFLFEILEALYEQVMSYTFADWCSIIGVFLAIRNEFRDTKKK